MVSSSLYKRIWKNTIKRFLFTLENQPISPHPDVWMVQRRRSSQHRKLAKVAFKKENWTTVGIMLLKQTHVIVRSADQRFARNHQRGHIIQSWRTSVSSKTFWIGTGILVYVGEKLNTVYSLIIATYLKFMTAPSNADRCCTMISRRRPRDNYPSLGDTRPRWYIYKTKTVFSLSNLINSIQDSDSPDRCCSML